MEIGWSLCLKVIDLTPGNSFPEFVLAYFIDEFGIFTVQGVGITGNFGGFCY